MGKTSNIRRDIARARPCRLCKAPVFIVRVNYRVVPASLHGDWSNPHDGALDLVSMPTRFAMILDQEPDDDGFYVVNADINAIEETEGFVAYDPERSVDSDHWGFMRYRGHDCPMTNEMRERAHGNRTFLDGRILRRLVPSDAGAVSSVD